VTLLWLLFAAYRMLIIAFAHDEILYYL